MYYILLLSSVLCTAILFFICYKKIDKTEVIYDDNVSPVVEKLGDNETITNIVLQRINNYTTKKYIQTKEYVFIKRENFIDLIIYIL